MAARNTQKTVYVAITEQEVGVYESLGTLADDHRGKVSINTLMKYNGEYSNKKITVKRCQLIKRKQGGKGRPFQSY